MAASSIPAGSQESVSVFEAVAARVGYIVETAVRALADLLEVEPPGEKVALTRAHFAQFRNEWERLLSDQTTALRSAIDELIESRYGSPAEQTAPSFLDFALRSVSWLSIDGGEVLIRQGEPAGSIFLLLSGELAVSMSAAGSDRPDTRVEVGEIAGEIEFVSGGTYRASLTATRDSELIALSQDAVEQLARLCPGLWKRIARSAVSHLDRQMPGVAEKRKVTATIAILAADGDAAASTFTNRLVLALAQFGPTSCVSSHSIDRDLGAGHAQASAGSIRDTTLRAYLDRHGRENHYVVYECDRGRTSWTNRSIRQADRVLVIASSGSEPDFPAIEAAISPKSCELVVLRPDGVRNSAWRLSQQVRLVHNVNLGSGRDLARLARLVAGRAMGLVLGGGGARCLAHIGVVRAFEECGLEIDAIGGTSMGACIAGEYALGWSYQEVLERSRIAFRKSPSDYVFPRIALLSGRQVCRTLMGLFGEIRIEDLPIPYFAVSADLVTGLPVVHREGKLWRAVRASSSVPGVLPPVAGRGELLIDGGVLDNLPVKAMAALAPGIRIATVDVNPYGYEAFIQCPPYGESFGIRKILGSLNPFGRSAPAPGIAAILERTSMLNSVNQANSLKHWMSLYIHPPTDQVGFLDVKKIDEIADLGYQYAMLELEGWLRTGPETQAS